jgi:translation initiation factor 1
MKKPPPERVPIDGAPALTHNPFAKLQGAAAPVPTSAPTPPLTPAAVLAGRPRPVPPRAVVRLERKGRNGKEVTVVEQLKLRTCDLEDTLKAMKKSLGCGGTLEGETLVLQGDQGDRVEAWLAALGVARVIRGS